ncbi:hypothetical protein ETD83_10800 [Actinomadura soli]|uniref:Uncharacterized protein n=1 Tax=Actinomadura soli TaxID=2508997 RepID=A0A5C4JFZ1_9ACTN|nr:hypothetical protein [Actinomadura soli]TMR03389.1 hypothetical protein ETD83_10800 [Actinomadura soli]
MEQEEEPFREFCEAVTRAHAHGQHANVSRIDRAAEGGYVVRRRTRRYRDPASGQVVEEREDDLAPPDWRAAAWLLERRHHEGLARPSHLQVSGPDGGPVEMAETPGLALSPNVSPRAWPSTGPSKRQSRSESGRVDGPTHGR